MSKMKNCKACGAEIATSAKSCPKCGAKNKKPIWKRVWVWILIFLVAVVAISGDSEEKTNNSSSDDISTSISTPVENETSFNKDTNTKDNENAVEAYISAQSSLIELTHEDNPYKIYEEDGYIYIDIWQENLANDLSTCIIYNQLDPWNTLVEVSCQTSIEMQKLAETMGVDMGVVYSWYDVVDDKDTAFLVCSRGNVIFNMLEAISN